MSLAIYLVGVFTVVAVMLSSYYLGERSLDKSGQGPYESGIKASGTARIRFFTHYFLLAILFVIFDMESVLLYVWSSSVREIGWIGFFQMLFFIGMLLLALIYAFSMNVLKLLPTSKKMGEKSS